jgi:hypothetical protein
VLAKGHANDNAEITLSGRKATGNNEPSWDKTMGLNVLEPNPDDAHPNGIKDDTFFIGGHCPNCTSKAGISATNKFQSFIFAIGPIAHDPKSNSPSAPLRRHSFYGRFSLDMTQAHGQSAPALGTTKVGVNDKGEKVTIDHERASSGHALVMCVAFVIVFPLGVFLLRILEKVNLHMYMQSFGLLLVLIGFISGLVVSRTYNRVRLTEFSIFVSIDTRETNHCLPFRARTTTMVIKSSGL